MNKYEAIAEAKKLAIKLDVVACYACRYATTGWTFLPNKPTLRPAEVIEVLQNGTTQLA